MAKAGLSVKEQESQLDYQFKVLLIGDSGVGKTSIMSRFTENKFNPDIKSTIGVEYSKKTITVGGTMIQTSIWDTAGQERFRALAKSYYKGAQGALVVFDVTKPLSLENVTKVWSQEIKQSASDKIKMILVGNKADLEEDRTVKQEDALKVASELGWAYLETSALNCQNIETAFETLVKEIFESMGRLPADLRPKSLTMKKEHSSPSQSRNFQIDFDKKQQKKSCC